MKEQFATYEIALKLKELGFNEKCFGYYKPMKEWMMEGTKFNSERHFHGCNWANLDNTMYFMYIQNSFGDREASIKNSEFTKAIENIAVPLWQQAIDWLREKYVGNIIIMSCIIPSNEIKYYIFKGKLKWDWNELYDTYEEAREQAILKAIEIVKKENNK